MLALAGAPALLATARASKFSAKTIDGEILDAATVRGKNVLVQFWTTWCTYCQSDEGPIEAVGKAFARKGLVVLAVNAYEPLQKVQDYLRKHPRECKIALLSDTNLAYLLKARSYPVYVLFDRGGNPIETQNGAGGEAALRRLVQRAGF